MEFAREELSKKEELVRRGVGGGEMRFKKIFFGVNSMILNFIVRIL